MDVSAKNKKELYELNDLYLQPSWFEGYENAFYRGNELWFWNTQPPPEVVSSSGLVVFEISPKHIYEKLSYLLKLTKNDKRKLVKVATKRVIHKFNFER